MRPLVLLSFVGPISAAQALKKKAQGRGRKQKTGINKVSNGQKIF